MLVPLLTGIFPTRYEVAIAFVFEYLASCIIVYIYHKIRKSNEKEGYVKGEGKRSPTTCSGTSAGLKRWFQGYFVNIHYF